MGSLETNSNGRNIGLSEYWAVGILGTPVQRWGHGQIRFLRICAHLNGFIISLWEIKQGMYQ